MDVRISDPPAATCAVLHTTNSLFEMTDLGEALPANQSKKVTLDNVSRFIRTAAVMLTSLTLGAAGAAFPVSGTPTVGTDIAAGAITLTANLSTGNAAPGTFIFKVGAQVAGSSAVAQTAGTALTLSNTTAAGHLAIFGGKIQLGAAPGTAAAINIDAATAASTLAWKNGANSGAVGMTGTVTNLLSTTSIYFTANSQDKWLMAGAATIAELASAQVTARIIGGSTNGLAIRNSGNTRDNWRVFDSGGYVSLNDGTRAGAFGLTSAIGEIPAGLTVGGGNATDNTFLVPLAVGSGLTTAGEKAGVAYHNQTQFYSAIEVANVAAGFGTLSLMKSGGSVTIGTANAATTFTIGSSVTAAGGVGYSMYFANMIVAAANSDVLTSMKFVPGTTPGAFTALVRKIIDIAAFSVAAYTTPGDPIAIDVGVVTGTGATNAYALKLAAPVGAGTLNLSLWALGAIKVDGAATFGSTLTAAGGLGYAVGSGGAVTQLTSKSTGVTLNKLCGEITMDDEALAGHSSVSFSLTNSFIAATDYVMVQHESAGTIGHYNVHASTTDVGHVHIVVESIDSGNLSEAIVLRFMVMKGALT